MKTAKILLLSTLMVTLTLVSSCKGEGGKRLIHRKDKSAKVVPKGEEPKVSEDLEKEVSEAVNAIYSSVMDSYKEGFPDALSEQYSAKRDSFLTEDLRALIQKAIKDSKEDGALPFEAGYWIMGQDFDRPSFKFIQSTVKDATHAKARVRVSPHGDEMMDGEGVDVDVTLKKENGKWKVDDFYNRKFEYSIRKSISEETD